MDLSHWMNATIVVKSLDGLDGRMRPVYGTARTIACKRTVYTETVQGPQGITRRTRTKFLTHDELFPTDIIWDVAGGADSTNDADAVRPQDVAASELPTGTKLYQAWL